MGKPGSGRHPEKKFVAENCLRVHIADLLKTKESTGDLVWHQGGALVGVASFERCGKTIVLRYPVASEKGNELVTLQVSLEDRPVQFRGERLTWFWFVCPECRDRRKVLYLPPGGRVFACRWCHDVAYLSWREAHRYDRAVSRWKRWTLTGSKQVFDKK